MSSALRARGFHRLRHPPPLVARIEAEGGRARAFGSDARKEELMVALIETIEREEGGIEVAAFNINVRFPIRDMTARVYFKVWEMCAFAGFLMGREVAKALVPRGRGTIRPCRAPSAETGCGAMPMPRALRLSRPILAARTDSSEAHSAREKT